jgi:hypothetical protein
MTEKARPGTKLGLPPLDAATAAWIVDLCQQLQRGCWALLRR